MPARKLPIFRRHHHDLNEIFNFTLQMGWKKLRDHFRIEHFVRITPAGVCIGSSYVHDLIVVGTDGKIRKRYERNDDLLGRYQREIEVNPDMVAALLSSPDTFERDIEIFTYDDSGEILAKRCEIPAWPNVTHDGEMIFNNTFSTDRLKVVGWAKRSADLAIDSARENLRETETQLGKRQARLAETLASRQKLESDFPDSA